MQRNFSQLVIQIFVFEQINEAEKPLHILRNRKLHVKKYSLK